MITKWRGDRAADPKTQLGALPSAVAHTRIPKGIWVTYAFGFGKRGTAHRALRPCRRAAFR